MAANKKAIEKFEINVSHFTGKSWSNVSKINSDCHNKYAPEEIFIEKPDYIVDAIDTVAAKVELIVRADKCGVKIISSMGTGNKLNPELFEIADIYKTSVCPLAKVMRSLCKKAGIKHLKVVYSKEQPITPHELENAEQKGTVG